ncbi:MULTISPECIES: HAD family hydrolase [Streptomyces]|uniref:HAD family hydrolase n=1 Tax=Streptomyces TaxID=1883 RepID=UPI00163CAFFD|nr:MULTISPECIES: HAD family hydrolase [Streptomyces]MBC2879329.1 HAD hydrolase-like protein [Streptomyces sp. TYQ1024]UBI40074.1 HAD family hydrolase [Streptomyces mobaraensis]UKW32653.1 HAD family hydrolase [Streptomyces sp. TYQ1024]
MSGRPTAVWGFDGTLGHRRQGTWAECLLEVLDRQHPGHPFSQPQLFTALRSGFPWHDHHRPHPHLNTADRWWNHVTNVISSALRGLGLQAGTAAAVAHHTRDVYTDPAAWSLYPQAIAVLELLTSHGWDHILLTNHVPELPGLLDHLQLSGHLHAVINSADTGFEKPHPKAFASALAASAGCRYMVGDNHRADITGAQSAGLDAIWVRRNQPDDVPDLHTAVRLILGTEHRTETAAPRTWEVAPLHSEQTTPTAPFS